MGLLLLLATLFMGFVFCETNARTAALGSYAEPSSFGGYMLMTDFKSMATAAGTEFASDSPSVRSQARTDYTAWRDKAVSEVDATTHIAPVTDWLSWRAVTAPQSPALIARLKTASSAYLEDVSLARALRDSGNEEAAQEKFQASVQEMNTDLYPVAQALFDSGNKAFRQTVSVYNDWHNRLVIANYLVAAGLLAFIAWQYMFILRRGDRAILQGTLVTFLLTAAVAGYAYQGLQGVNQHVQTAVVTVYPTMFPPARIELLAKSQVDATAVRQDLVVVTQGDLSFAADIGKADRRIRFLPAAPLFFFCAYLFFKLTVRRSLKPY
jgi:hypothetical protein